MFKKIVILIVIAIIAVLILASTKPDTFRVERTIAIKAPPEKIFAVLENFHRWNSWSPYENVDPNMQRTFSGADSGKGAVYTWEGNSKAGAGRMEIVEISPPTAIVIQLDFSKPFKAHNTAEYMLESRGDSTYVTWAMYGPNLFVAKVMSVFFNMDKMIGKEFEKGLANLKFVTET